MKLVVIQMRMVQMTLMPLTLPNQTKKAQGSVYIYFFFNTILCQYLSDFIFMDNLDGNEGDFKNYTF